MNSKTDRERKEAKRLAVVAQIHAIYPNLEVLSGMWDERSLDALALALGIAHVELTKE